MTNQYYIEEKKAGDFIIAKDWNDMQLNIRRHIQSHTHAGGNQGARIAGNAIRADAVVTVGEITVSRALKVNGNIGVGTDQPGAKLSFNNMDDGTDGADGITWSNADPTQHGIHRTPGPWSAPDFQQLRLGWTAGILLDPGTEHGKSYVDIQGKGLRVTTGNVGIGTTNPQGMLDVNGDIHAGNSDIYFTKTDHNHTGTGNTPGHAAIENATDFNSLMILGRAGAKAGAGGQQRYVRLWDYLQVNGGLDVTGNVGIGTEAPDAKLHIDGGADAELNRSGFLVIGPVSGANLNIDNNEILARNNGAASALHFQANAGDLWVHSKKDEGSQFIIKDDGKVGIGTNNPTTMLSLGRPVQARMLALHDNPNDWYGLGIQGGQMRLQVGNTNARFSFFGDDNSEVMTVRGNGNVEVSGSLAAATIQTTLHTATGTGAVNLVNTNQWTNFPDLSIAINVAQPANVIAYYQVSMAGGDSHLVTRLRVRNTNPHISRAISGNVTYWSASNIWMGELPAGNSTITVQYRTPQGGNNNPGGSDWNNRVLHVMVFGRSTESVSRVLTAEVVTPAVEAEPVVFQPIINRPFTIRGIP